VGPLYLIYDLHSNKGCPNQVTKIDRFCNITIKTKQNSNNNDNESNNTSINNIKSRKEQNCNKMIAINRVCGFPFVSVAKNGSARPYSHVAGTPSLSSNKVMTMMTKTNGFPIDFFYSCCILLNLMISASCWLQNFYRFTNDFFAKNGSQPWSIVFCFVSAVFEGEEHIIEYNIHIYMDLSVRFRAIRISNKNKGFSWLLVP
jgi:hypothetical protein